MPEEWRWEEPDDLIQVPLFDSAIAAAESGLTAAPRGGRSGVCEGIGEGLVSCASSRVPQGSRM